MIELERFSLPLNEEYGAPTCSARFSIEQDKLRLEYEWESSETDAVLAPIKIEDFDIAEFVPAEFEPVRTRELWLATCFECFIQPNAMKPEYFEINTSPGGMWNTYRFQKYRFPQPPSETNQIRLIEFYRSESRLVCKYKLDINLSNPRISLNAILYCESGEKHFFATNHAGPKPDFHLAKGLTLTIREW